jgi:hypothetical protein
MMLLLVTIEMKTRLERDLPISRRRPTRFPHVTGAKTLLS